jgi:hypothetical protein
MKDATKYKNLLKSFKIKNPYYPSRRYSPSYTKLVVKKRIVANVIPEMIDRILILVLKLKAFSSKTYLHTMIKNEQVNKEATKGDKNLLNL